MLMASTLFLLDNLVRNASATFATSLAQKRNFCTSSVQQGLLVRPVIPEWVALKHPQRTCVILVEVSRLQ
jgi:hypothetical protein